MSIEKIQTLHNQSKEIIQNQKSAIKKTQDALFLLGKNYGNLLFSEFRKKFRLLISSLDLEEYQEQISKKLSETENLIKETQNQTSSTNQSNEDTLNFLLNIQQSLEEQQSLLNTFSESMLALRCAPLAKFFGKSDSEQIDSFKKQMLTLLKEKQKNLSRLEKNIMSTKCNRFFSIKLIVHLGILSPFNHGHSQINPLIQLVLDGFVANKIECYKQEAGQQRMQLARKTAAFQNDMDALARGEQPSLQLPPPFFSFNFKQT